jgi:hypothetical protein
MNGEKMGGVMAYTWHTLTFVEARESHLEDKTPDVFGAEHVPRDIILKRGNVRAMRWITKRPFFF